MALNLDSKMKCLIHDVLEICIVELRSEHRIAVHWVMLDRLLLKKHNTRGNSLPGVRGLRCVNPFSATELGVSGELFAQIHE